jgi:hypothetical protein
LNYLFTDTHKQRSVTQMLQCFTLALLIVVLLIVAAQIEKLQKLPHCIETMFSISDLLAEDGLSSDLKEYNLHSSSPGPKSPSAMKLAAVGAGSSSPQPATKPPASPMAPRSANPPASPMAQTAAKPAASPEAKPANKPPASPLAQTAAKPPAEGRVKEQIIMALEKLRKSKKGDQAAEEEPRCTLSHPTHWSRFKFKLCNFNFIAHRLQGFSRDLHQNTYVVALIPNFGVITCYSPYTIARLCCRGDSFAARLLRVDVASCCIAAWLLVAVGVLALAAQNCDLV